MSKSISTGVPTFKQHRGTLPAGFDGKAARDLPPQSETPDYQELRKQINDYESTFYGPHACDDCGDQIVKMAVEQGGHAYDLPLPPHGTKYKPHVCKAPAKHPGKIHLDAVNYEVRHLAGRVLTLIDASFSITEQRKAAKDLVKTEFKRTLNDLWASAYSPKGCASSPLNPLQELD